MVDWSIVKLIDRYSVEHSVKAERLTHDIVRQPMISPLPGEPTSGESNVLIVDLGIMTQPISISGFIDVVPEGEFMSKAQLEDAARIWWKDANWATGEGMMKLKTPLEEVYLGAVKTVRLSLEGGRNFYTFNLDFVVYKRETP